MVKKAGDETIGGVKTFTSAPVVPDATLQENPVTLNQLEQTTGEVSREIVHGQQSYNLSDSFDQNYTTYLWVLNSAIAERGKLKSINILTNGVSGAFNFYLVSGTNTEFTVKKIITTTLPANAGGYGMITLIAGVDFESGIIVEQGWKIAFLNKTSTIKFRINNVNSTLYAGLLKVVSTDPVVGESFSSFANVFGFFPVIGCKLNTVGIDYRVRELEKHSVKYYGAVGDGITDDKIAIQNAINANYNSYVSFEDGTYYVSGSIIVTKTIEIRGNFRSSFIKGTGNFNLFSVIGGLFSLNGLSFIGSGKAENSTKPSQYGIYIYSVSDSNADPFKINIRNAEFLNLAGTGLAMRLLGTDVSGIFKGNSIHNINAYDCHQGIHLDRRAEFTTLSVFNINGCTTGLRLSGGNMVVGDGSITQCTNGLVIDDGLDNSGHGTISNCGIKHNVWNILAENTQYGFILNSLNIFDGNIKLKNVKGFQFCNCQLDVNSYYFEGAVKSRFVNNLLYDSVYTLYHNYNGTTSDVAFDETLKMS
jgi:hypothetical protein